MFRKVYSDECRLEKINKLVEDWARKRTHPPEIWEHLFNHYSSAEPLFYTPLMEKTATEIDITCEELVAWYKWDIEKISGCGSI